MEALFGPTLIGKSGPVASSSLNARYVLVYFSAHWCPPCRGFTPKLGMFYDAVNSGAKQVEIVYISRDKTPDQFNEYYSEMPWLALPFEDKARIAALGNRFQVQQIPCLILIDNQGNMKRNTCRMDVTNKGPNCLADWEQALSR
ncbi:hypothetical protein SteCoe_32060 [Stentor coeruleus]|uniref:Thioredoxin domain-containing protein n=1 Tax=Stentor coeruleus TaxID=5963 RepID=A0A1R2AZX2_9CILI|nr:hypothetical protein SteCoe_32060 [Stentor coeruleus]